MRQQQRILITGASRGLGASLARRLAGQGIHLDLCARDISNVRELSETLISLGSTVAWASVDVADIPSVTEWIETICSQVPIDMLVLNAGVFDGRGEDGALETPTRAAALLGTNLTSAVVVALTVAEKMRAQNYGHIVFVSSLASFAAHADAPTYSASKAGVTSFARALREDLASSNVRVTLIHPGHIATQQTQQHIGAMPGLVSSEVAADRIVAGMRRGKSEINFPWILRLGLACLAILPWRLRAKLNQPFRFQVRNLPPSERS
ncbi:MAG: SDR family NAD(P)-dependent oxidoreductase [Sulfitobacter sp.]|nr:SDR family NAD(P)-dependent oxidoreductase [Sulfitobacter sp.]